MRRIYVENSPDYWVPIDIVAGFKCMGEFQRKSQFVCPFHLAASLSHLNSAKGPEWLASVLRSSDGLLEVDEESTQVRSLVL